MYLGVADSRRRSHPNLVEEDNRRAPVEGPGNQEEGSRRPSPAEAEGTHTPAAASEGGMVVGTVEEGGVGMLQQWCMMNSMMSTRCSAPLVEADHFDHYSFAACAYPACPGQCSSSQCCRPSRHPCP